MLSSSRAALWMVDDVHHITKLSPSPNKRPESRQAGRQAGTAPAKHSGPSCLARTGARLAGWLAHQLAGLGDTAPPLSVFFVRVSSRISFSLALLFYPPVARLLSSLVSVSKQPTTPTGADAPRLPTTRASALISFDSLVDRCPSCKHPLPAFDRFESLLHRAKAFITRRGEADDVMCDV